MEYDFGVQKTKAKVPPGKTKRRVIGVKTPTRAAAPPGLIDVTGGNPDNFCPAPGSVPVEAGEDESLTTTQFERKALAEYAMRKQKELPEVIILENSIASFGYEQLKKIAVCRVENRNVSGPGSINDTRMGVIEGNKQCMTCYMSSECPGHLGYIELDEPIYHPFYLREVIQVLNCLCRSCSRLILTKKEIIDKDIHKYSLKERLNYLEEASKGVTCKRKPVKMPGGKVVQCKPNYIYNAQKMKDNNQVQYQKSKDDKEILVMSIEKVMRILQAISDSDAVLLGFNPKLGSRPVNMIMRALPVTPPITRYPTPLDGKLQRHSITDQYLKILKYNMDLGKIPKVKEKEDGRLAMKKKLVGAIQQLFENSDKGSTFTGKQSRSFKDLIQGKEALIRGLMMGKRGNYIARTVLSPMPSLKFGQLGVPEAFAPYLTRQETVYDYNKRAMEALLEETEFKAVEFEKGGLTPKLVTQKGRKITHIIFGPGHQKKVGQRMALKPGIEYTLMIGDKVERHLRNGDLIAFGRQPTLHKHNLMAYEVVLINQLTIGLHLSYSTPLNADESISY